MIDVYELKPLREDWKMPVPPGRLCACGLPLNVPTAIDEGEWVLAWDCDNGCGDCEIMDVKVWPFESDTACGVDMMHAGFNVV